jgi:hypothetical protein
LRFKDNQTAQSWAETLARAIQSCNGVPFSVGDKQYVDEAQFSDAGLIYSGPYPTFQAASTEYTWDSANHTGTGTGTAQSTRVTIVGEYASSMMFTYANGPSSLVNETTLEGKVVARLARLPGN